MVAKLRFVRLGLLAFVALGMIGVALGQGLEEGQVAFEKKARKTSELRQELFKKGALSADPKDKNHLEAIDHAAREAVYPLYWIADAGSFKAGEMNDVVERFTERLTALNRARPASNTTLRLYCKNVIDRAAEVVQQGKPITGINGTRILAAIPQRRAERGSGVPVPEKTWIEEVLPRLAEGNAEHLAETSLTLLSGPKITDGHRYYLYRCLASLLSLPPQTPPLLKQETADKILQAALKQVEKKVPFPRAAPRQEVEGYKILRQQAIVVLAAGRQPTVGDKDRPVLALTRVAGGDADLAPPPRFTERLEAAIGLARMAQAAAKVPDLQMDYAAAMIVAAVADFGKQANANVEAKADLRVRPWRVDAARMNEALDDLKKAAKTPYVQEVVKQCQSVLRDVEASRPSPANQLTDWLARNSPAAKSLFKSDPASTVKGAGPAPE